MNKEEYIKFISFDNISGKKCNEKWLKKNYPEIFNEIIEYSGNLEIPFNQRVFHYIHNITDIPKCLNCGDNVRFSYRNGAGYNKYCSSACSNKSKEKIDIIKKSSFKKYGTICSLQNSDVREKSEKTKEILYNNKEFRNIDKAKKTKKIKYGNENYNNPKKTKITKKNRYNNENYNNLEKAKITKKNRHNDENYNNREKFSQTMLNRYGENFTNIINKRKKTCLAKFNVDAYSKTLEFKNRIKELHYKRTKTSWANYLNLNDSDIIVDGENFTIKNYCKIHKEFFIDKKNFYNRLSNQINLCMQCYPIGEQTSIVENEIFDAIKKIYNGIIERKYRKFDETKTEIDIYIPEHKIGIECNGLYWHSELFKEKYYHKNKNELCTKNEIQLLQIFDDEWKNKKNIVLSMIKHKLNLINNKIFARKCEIKTVKPDIARKFLNDNHIQGSCKSNYHIGLYYSNDLVSLMSFEKTRKSQSSQKDSYNLNRFCNKIDCIVVGSASKLLKYFTKTNNPKEIITFADKRYSNGKLYEILGFIKNKDVDVSYYVFHKHEYIRYHRFRFNKKQQVKMGFDPNKSETENLKLNGYLKIWDCGKIKYVKNFV